MDAAATGDSKSPAPNRESPPLRSICGSVFRSVPKTHSEAGKGKAASRLRLVMDVPLHLSSVTSPGLLAESHAWSLPGQSVPEAGWSGCAPQQHTCALRLRAPGHPPPRLRDQRDAETPCPPRAARSSVCCPPPRGKHRTRRTSTLTARRATLGVSQWGHGHTNQVQGFELSRPKGNPEQPDTPRALRTGHRHRGHGHRRTCTSQRSRVTTGDLWPNSATD